MSEFPPPGPDFEEEEEEHEDEAGADVQNHTQAHVHTVKTQTQNPNPPLSSSQDQNLLPTQSLVSRLQLYGSSSSRLLLWLAGLYWIRIGTRMSIGRRCAESWGSQGVFGGDVGGAVVVSEEEEDVVVVPHVDPVFLLVAGGAEGGARPRSFREEGVIAERAWRGRSLCYIINQTKVTFLKNILF